MSKAIDLFILYRIIKDLSTPFDKTEAFKLGLINAKGERLRDDKGVKKLPKTKAEKDADGYYQRFIRNIKKLMTKVGLGSRVATFAAAMLLIKESVDSKYALTENSFEDEDLILEELVRTIKYLEKNSQKNFRQLEEEIANVTGPAVAGTGDDPVHWKKMPYKVGAKGERKRKGRYINGVAFLKRTAREAARKQKELENGRTET